ncbi:SH3 domain-containing protein [Clostridium botulinum]|uniref:SH3 domain-containing protein n=1 Tax=Clostridium botulinum TaxID=1491 RepID=UPI00046F1E8E|nr:SH3 domain-containing protein [Clostridium botulinum]MCC5423025.1 SH3 domain-containing protein [Clostridium botulinum]NFL54505.1 SH3 domain-containing protein [Clostridium botulinum]OPD23698.1 hypothetical protein AL710_05935 [Clostridium botulinum]
MIKKKIAGALAICSFLTFTYGTTAFAANYSTNNAVQNESVTQSRRKRAICVAVGKVTADVLNVRKSASTSSNIIGQLDYGDRIDIEDMHIEGWYRIHFEGGFGWVSSQYVKIVEAP